VIQCLRYIVDEDFFSDQQHQRSHPVNTFVPAPISCNDDDEDGGQYDEDGGQYDEDGGQYDEDGGEDEAAVVHTAE
jgi:hypothetical protein